MVRNGRALGALAHFVCVFVALASDGQHVAIGETSSTDAEYFEDVVRCVKSLKNPWPDALFVKFSKLDDTLIGVLGSFGAVGIDLLKLLGCCETKATPTSPGVSAHSAAARAKALARLRPGKAAAGAEAGEDVEEEEGCCVCWGPGTDEDPLVYPVINLESAGRFAVDGPIRQLRACRHRVHRDCFRSGSCPLCRCFRNGVFPDVLSDRDAASALVERVAVLEVRLRSNPGAVSDEGIPIVKLLASSLRSSDPAVFPETPLGTFIASFLKNGDCSSLISEVAAKVEDPVSRHEFVRRALLFMLLLSDASSEWQAQSELETLAKRFSLELAPVQSWVPLELPDDYFRLFVGRPGFELAENRSMIGITTPQFCANMQSVRLDRRPELFLGGGSFATMPMVFVPGLKTAVDLPSFYRTSAGPADVGLRAGQIPTLSREDYLRTLDEFLSGAYLDRIDPAQVQIAVNGGMNNFAGLEADLPFWG